MRGRAHIAMIGLIVGFASLPELGHGQSPWPAPPPIDQRWPTEPAPPQQRAQPPARPQPSQPARPVQDEQPTATAKPRKPAAPPARAVACSGPFAKDTNHLQLAAKFGSENLTFTDVDGPNGAKLKASVLFPKDPKKRIEVWWSNEASRSDLALIVINGQSTWNAPKGVRIGLSLAALEKINGKPFMLSGFDSENASAVSDWQGGALASLPGGCKISVRFAPDPKAPAEARSEVSGDKTLASSDVNMRAVSPKAIEILIGY